MKKFLVLLFSSLLILGACSNNNDSSKENSDKISETNSSKNLKIQIKINQKIKV